MRANLLTGYFVVAGLLAGLSAQAVLAQRGTGQGKALGSKAAKAEVREPRGEGVGRPRGSGPRREGLPPAWMERLHAMTPEQQEQFLNNNERFRILPAARQAEIRENLRHWNSLDPEQQRAVREREEIWRMMSAEQRRRVREEILPRWRNLEPARRQAVMRRLRALRDLNDEQRTARLSDESFLTGLSAEDQELLRVLSRLRIGPGVERSEPSPEKPPS